MNTVLNRKNYRQDNLIILFIVLTPILQETVTGMNEELNFYKKEIQTLRSEKETLEDVLNRKAGDIRKNLANEVLR